MLSAISAMTEGSRTDRKDDCENIRCTRTPAHQSETDATYASLTPTPETYRSVAGAKPYMPLLETLLYATVATASRSNSIREPSSLLPPETRARNRKTVLLLL